MITVYSRPGCVQCEWTKKWLDKLGHTYHEIDVDNDPAAESRLISLGFGTLPVVVTPTDRWAGFKLEKLRTI